MIQQRGFAAALQHNQNDVNRILQNVLRNCESHDDAAQRCVNDAVVILETAISNSYWGCSITKPAYTSWPHTFYFAYTDNYYISCSPWSDKAVNERQFNYMCDEFGFQCTKDTQSNDADTLIACMRDFFLSEGPSSKGLESNVLATSWPLKVLTRNLNLEVAKALC